MQVRFIPSQSANGNLVWKGNSRSKFIKGLWYAYDPIAKTWIAVDNSTSSAFTEEFSTKEEAIKWLQNP